MSAAKSIRLTATTMVFAAAILALVFLLPSLSRPAPVSAQTCGYGTTYVNGVCSATGGCANLIFGFNCSSSCSGSSVGCYNNGSCQAGYYSNGYGCYQSTSGNCPNGFTYTVTGCSIYSAGNCPSGTVYSGVGCQSNGACPTNYSYSAVNCTSGNCPLGYSYTAAGCSRSANCSASYSYTVAGCSTNTNCPVGYSYTISGCGSSTTCASAGFSVGASSGQYCSSNSALNGVNGSCAGRVLQAGQSCSNGVISGAGTCPNGQAIAQGAVCSTAAINAATNTTTASSTYCTADGLLPVVEACTSAANQTTSASVNQCAGLTLASGQTCANGVVTCANGQIVAPSQPCPATTNATYSSISSTSGGVSVSYSGGWNLVAAPDGTSIAGAGGSLYTFQAGDSDYETLQAGATVKSGQGYWAYFGTSMTGNVPLTSAGTVTITLPAGASVMIGNSGSSMATVSGADSVLVFDPVSGTYSQATTLQPGQGAWASSANGGQATITNQ